ncbi:alpha/beta hydrolase family protein [Shewanella gelidii]|uniref:Peptidase S9 n=1 Tax=Shewanella gelidii TaxID=1642821 RepID=A0A917JRE2_9GAMM|nr:S9 family peptidase [Shewanella gelidii]MCL1098407.1 S9 family peptidase [Shewanella gelidii]GGI82961.1 peptidase S9 [Shewanella gelidii]
MNQLAKIILILFALCSSWSTFAGKQDLIQAFSKSSEFQNVQISPNGDYLSVIMEENNDAKLLILDMKTLKPTYIVDFQGKGEVGDYYWVNSERVVMEKVYRRKWEEIPHYYGELFAVDADGRKAKYLFGYKGGGGTGTNVNKTKAIRASAFVLDSMPENKKYILVHSRPWNNLNYAVSDVYKVNVYNGKRKKLTSSPTVNADFLVDHDGKVRFSFAQNDKNDDLNYYFDEQEDKWLTAERYQGDLKEFWPISFTEDNNAIYAYGREQENTRALYKINLTTNQREKIIQHDVVDPDDYYIDYQSKLLYAVQFHDGYPEYRFLDSKSEKAKTVKQLQATFPDHYVSIVSQTQDGERLIIRISNDKNPGDYYLYDHKNVKLNYLFSSRSWLEPEDMSEVKPYSFKNRDGLTIHGYITIPKGKALKNLPLVVNPHGGPHGPRDYWSFNSENQLLAQRGIAVLQVNFRGSGGYGLAFEEAGYNAWGSKIQYDIIDATKYAIEQGWANQDKICISGGSFGGYSALMAPTLAPDLYQCAVGTAGVYDLQEMFDSGDIPDYYGGEAYLTEVLGNDPEVLKEMSPTNHVDKLKAKVLLLHGEEDERAPMEQFEAMEKALQKANYPYEKKIWTKAGHGFYTPESRAEYYDALLSFIETNLAL